MPREIHNVSLDHGRYPRASTIAGPSQGSGSIGVGISDDEASEAWNLLEDLENPTTPGAMTDASRRLRDEAELEMHQAPIVRAKAKAKSAATAPGGYQNQHTPGAGSAVNPADLLVGGMEAFEAELAIPPGVGDIHTWGRTVIEFGKYKGKNVGYEELLGVDPNYVQWVITHETASSHPLFPDLAAFLKLRTSLESSDGSYFPGSTVARKFK